MNLSDALSAARTSISNSSLEAAVLARNISGASETGYSRKLVASTSSDQAAMRVIVVRAANEGLQRALMDSNASAARASAVASGFDSIQQTLGDSQMSSSPASMLGALQIALQNYSVTPSNSNLASAAVQAAIDVAANLKDASRSVDEIRAQADAAMNISVDKINKDLDELAKVNVAIVRGGPNQMSSTDQLDERDRLVADIAGEIGVTVSRRADNGIVLTTDSGIVLFDREPRKLAFNPIQTFSPGAKGQPVFIDGVDATSPDAPMAIAGGRLAGLTVVRDQTSVQYQSQLDQIAQSLTNAFSERDQTDLTGQRASPAVFLLDPAGAGQPDTSGQASRIRVNASLISEQGGDPSRLRDGGAAAPGNPAFVVNSTGSPDFTERLNELVASLAPSHPGQALGPMDEATSSISWLEAGRQAAQSRLDESNAVAAHGMDALQKDIGVNLDDQLSRMLDVQNSFQASAKLLSIVDSMLSDLFKGIG